MASAEINRNSILRRLSEYKFDFTELSGEETESLRHKIFQRYGFGGEDESFFWRFGAFGSVGPEIYAPEGWVWLKDYLQNRETVLLHRPSEGTTAFRFSDGARLIWLLNGLNIGEFFLCNMDAEFLIFSYHHEVTSGAGLAEEWINELRNRVYFLLSIPPRNIVIADVQMQNWGNSLIFHCVYDPDGEKRPFMLYFDGCVIKEWRSPSIPRPEITFHIIVGQEAYKQPALIVTGAFDCTFSYRQVKAEW